jgi:hypothetical protein
VSGGGGEGSDPVSHRAPGAGSSEQEVSEVPSKRIQGWASSFDDGVRAGGDARCATSATQTRLFIRIRVARRVAFAGLFTAFIAGTQIVAVASQSQMNAKGKCFVAFSPDGALQGVSGGGGEGSDPVSHRAPGAGSPA